MPKASFRSDDMESAGNEYTRGGLPEVVQAVDRYLREHANEGGSAAAYESNNGLHIQMGHDAFMLAPYRKPPKVNTGDNFGGLYSFAELKRLNVPAPAPIIDGFLYEGETVLIAG